MPAACTVQALTGTGSVELVQEVSVRTLPRIAPLSASRPGAAPGGAAAGVDDTRITVTATGIAEQACVVSKKPLSPCVLTHQHVGDCAWAGFHELLQPARSSKIVYVLDIE